MYAVWALPLAADHALQDEFSLSEEPPLLVTTAAMIMTTITEAIARNSHL
jgi:hypothetical protein